MDLSPRTTTDVSSDAPAPAPRRRIGAWLMLGAVLITGGVVVAKFLTSAIDYYCNADEVGVKDQCSGDRRLRVQGTVDQGSVTEKSTGGIASFTVTFAGASIDVDYANGAVVPDLFQDCIPVVVAGQLEGGRLIGSSIEVKHSNEYQAENADRLDDGVSPACQLDDDAVVAEAGVQRDAVRAGPSGAG